MYQVTCCATQGTATGLAFVCSLFVCCHSTLSECCKANHACSMLDVGCGIMSYPMVLLCVLVNEFFISLWMALNFLRQYTICTTQRRGHSHKKTRTAKSKKLSCRSAQGGYDLLLSDLLLVCNKLLAIVGSSYCNENLRQARQSCCTQCFSIKTRVKG